MKKLVMILISVLIFNSSFSQWIQLGSDIYGESAGDNLGYSVSISSSGLVLVVGVIKGNVNSVSTGYVKAFEYSGGNWIQMGSNIDGVSKNDFTGYSVSLSSDGYIIGIGAPYNDEFGDYSGQVCVYRYTGNHWIQMGSDLNGDNAYSHFGNSVSLSSDGTTIAIGADGATSGQVKVFAFDGVEWIQKGKSIPGEADYDNWGCSVSISSDGNTVAGGAKYHNGTGWQTGYVRVYEFDGGKWIQLGGNINGDAEGNESGTSVSINHDGTIVAVGAPTDNSNGNNAGQVKLYKYTNGNWKQIGNDITGEAAGDVAGSSVSINSDGSIIAIGSYGSDGSFNNAGRVRVFENDAGDWVQIGNSIDGEAESDFFGTSLCINSTGNFLAVGAPESDGNGRETGEARVFHNCDISNDIIDIKVVGCKNYISPSGNYVWISSGIYMDTIHISAGCDIIYRIELEIKNNTDKPTVIDTTTCEDYISPSGNYIWKVSGTYLDIVPNSVGCDSTIVINLTGNTISTIDTVVCDEYTSPSGKYTWSTSGVYYDTIQNSTGCDSIITINLHSRTYADYIIVACDSTKYTSPSSKYVWETEGVYQDTIKTIAGCDSIITIDLSFNIDTSVTVYFYGLVSNETYASYQWIDCDNSNEPIPGATEQSFYPFMDGTYAVIVSKGGCTDTSNCLFHKYYDVPEYSTDDLKVYPIPTNGILRIEADNITKIEIRDLQGRQVYSGTESEVDLSNLPNGIYIVSVIVKMHTVHRKIIKQ